MGQGLINVYGVRGFIDINGIAQLNLEDVARGLGFIQRKGEIEYIRWERVNGHLTDMGFPQLVGKEFIPENIFYRLSMKGESESAIAFQTVVADEILPAIRKTGSYSTLITPSYMIEDPILRATKWIEEATERKQLESKIEADRPSILFAQTCLTSEKSMLVREVAKLASKSGIMIGEKRLFQKLREWGMIMQMRNEPTQRGMEPGYFEIKKGVTQTAKGARDFETTKVTPKGQIYIINRLNREIEVEKGAQII